MSETVDVEMEIEKTRRKKWRRVDSRYQQSIIIPAQCAIHGRCSAAFLLSLSSISPPRSGCPLARTEPAGSVSVRQLKTKGSLMG